LQYFSPALHNKKPISRGTKMGLRDQTKLYGLDYFRYTLSTGKLRHQLFVKENMLIGITMCASMSLGSLGGQG
tara:strand:- start:6548 stop:6766 length:219 start_codon:yes stop_codon:yes gene_type:complete